MLQSGKPAGSRVALGYDSVPRATIYGMAVLAALTLVASCGFFVLPGIITGGALNLQLVDSVLETAVVAMGAFAAYMIYARGKRMARGAVPERFIDFVHTARLVNNTYNHFAAFVEALASGFAYLDAKLNGLFDWSGHVAVSAGNSARRIASGGINAYVAIFAVGVLVLIAAVVL